MHCNLRLFFFEKMQLPYHLVITLTGLDKLLFVTGAKIVILESKTGKITTISESLGTAPTVIPTDQHAKKQLRTIVYHPAKKLLAFVSDDKELQIWDAQTLKVINKRTILKRATCNYIVT